MQAQKQRNQSEILAKELLDISPDVTRTDRQQFLKQHNYSKTTLSNYLNGMVSDNDTAVKIITFFRKRIADRYAQIGKH